jgi:hypothetical protein
LPIHFENKSISPEADGRFVATEQSRQYASADGRGTWIASRWPGRLLTRDQPITALTAEELLAARYTADHPQVVALREERR